MSHSNVEAQRDALTGRIISAAIEVHRHLGPGLLESAYEACLCWELHQAGFDVARQVALRLVYKDVRVDCGDRLDLVVERRVVIEIKAVDRTTRLHDAQLLTYLRLAGLHTGLLLNFNVRVLTDGVKRMVL